MHHPHLTFSILLMPSLLFFATLCHTASDQQRLHQLTQLRKSARKGLISFNIPMFESFIEASPRSYAIFIVITAPPQICNPCPAIVNVVSQVSSEYYKLSSSRAATKPLFFAELKLTHSDSQFLGKYNIHTVPILYNFPAARTRFTEALDDSSPNYYPVQQLGVDANSIRHFINSRTGSKLKVVKGNYKIPGLETVRQYMPLILFALFIFSAISVYTGVYKNPMFWFGVVVLVYIFSVGGGHYSWINKVPLAFVNKNGATEYIAAGLRSQYVAEGFFVSATCVSISVLVILIRELPSTVPNKEIQTLVGAILFVMTIFAITALLAMFGLKMPNYLHYSEI